MPYRPTPFSVDYLPKTHHTLLHKFYRHHKSSMRITEQADAWVERATEIIAGVCLSPVAEGFWLTSLFTAPAYRRQGIARLLINHLQDSYVDKPIWLFCHPQLEKFYCNLDFVTAHQLPEPLKSRLTRYQKNKTLIALCYHHS